MRFSDSAIPVNDSRNGGTTSKARFHLCKASSKRGEKRFASSEQRPETREWNVVRLPLGFSESKAVSKYLRAQPIRRGEDVVVLPGGPNLCDERALQFDGRRIFRDRVLRKILRARKIDVGRPRRLFLAVQPFSLGEEVFPLCI
jgi:hypothetical protein